MAAAMTNSANKLSVGAHIVKNECLFTSSREPGAIRWQTDPALQYDRCVSAEDFPHPALGSLRLTLFSMLQVYSMWCGVPKR